MPQKDLFPEEPAAPPILSVCELTAQIKDLLENSFPAVWVSGRNLEPLAAAVGPLLPDAQGRSGPDPRGHLAERRRPRAVRSARRPGGDLPRTPRRLCPAGQLPVDHRPDRAQGDGGAGAWPCGNSARNWPARGSSIPRGSGRCRGWCGGSAVVTSPTGAAIHDFLQVLGRRWRGADVLVVPTRVQGEGAAAEIAAAIGVANRLPLPIDCLVRHPRRRQPGRPLGVQRGSRWSAPSSPRGFRSFRPSATRST